MAASHRGSSSAGVLYPVHYVSLDYYLQHCWRTPVTAALCTILTLCNNTERALVCTKLCGGGGVVHYYAIVCLDSIALLHWHPQPSNSPYSTHFSKSQ